MTALEHPDRPATSQADLLLGAVHRLGWMPVLSRLAVEAWELQADRALFSLFLVDVRDEEAHRRAHLPGARCLPYGSFQADALAICAGRGRVLVLCAGGARSAEMAVWLRDRGVDASYLVGGMAGWTGPLESGVSS